MLTAKTLRGMHCSLALLTLLLTGCFSKAEPVMSVPDYWRNPSQMSMDAGWCRANPAERRGLPKCVNALEANGTWSINDGLITCRKGGTVNQTCVEAFIQRKGM